ncbi:hypothetical protein G6F32_014913 [Rhizopus arrhizus]|nr:hypothetical protein G6F32_014913 [Rhizopus arrhizus]
MHLRQDLRPVAIAGQREQEARTHHHRVAVGAEDGDGGTDGQDQRQRFAPESGGGIGQWCRRAGQAGQRALRHHLHRAIDDGDGDDHGDQRERNVAARIAVLAGRGRDVLEAGNARCGSM